MASKIAFESPVQTAGSSRAQMSEEGTPLLKQALQIFRKDKARKLSKGSCLRLNSSELKDEWDALGEDKKAFYIREAVPGRPLSQWAANSR